MSTIKNLSKYFLATIATILVLIGLGLTVFATTAHAQSSSAQIYINDLTLESSVFSAGDTVRGTFVMKNGGDQSISNANYNVFLVGGLQSNELYKYEFDSQVSDPVFLKANESKVINFEYQLPLVSGAYSMGEQLGIKVKAYSGAGEPFGWDDVIISVTDSGISFIELTDVSVVVDGQEFIANEGPTVNEGGQVSLNLTAKNSSNTAISNLTPQISIYEMDYVKNSLTNYSEETFSIDVNSENNLEFALPTFDYTPKVYAGELVIVDADGINRSNPVRFRYIVGGDVVNIRNVILSESSVQSGDDISVSVEYSGIPFDITASDDEDLDRETGEVDFELKLFNEKNELIAEYRDSDTFELAGVKRLSVTASDDAQAIGVKIVITKDGKVISDYDTVISDADGVNIDTNERSAFHNLTLLIILLIILIALFFFVRSKFQKDLLVVLMIFVGTGFVVGNISAFTEVTSYGWNNNSSHTRADITLSINSPQDGGTYEPGETFRVSGTSYSFLCNNSTTDTNVYSSPITQDTSWPYTGTQGQQDYDPTSGMTQIGDNTTADGGCGGSSWCTKDFEFSSNLYTAPSTEGTYRIYVHGQTIQNAHNETAFTASYEMGYIEFDVVCSSGNCGEPEEGEEGEGGEEGPEGSSDTEGQCAADPGPFSSFPSTYSLLCEQGAVEEGSHSEDEWKWSCVGTEKSKSCKADKILGGEASLELIDEDIDPSDDLDSNPDLSAIVNSGEQCTIRWDVTSAFSTGTCSVIGESTGSAGSVSYPDGTYSVDVDSGDKYTITCTDDVDAGVTDTSEQLNCVLNPSIIEE